MIARDQQQTSSGACFIDNAVPLPTAAAMHPGLGCCYQVNVTTVTSAVEFAFCWGGHLSQVEPNCTSFSSACCAAHCIHLPTSPCRQSRLSPASALHLTVEVPALDLSLVDGRPQELLLLTLDGLTVEYHAGNSAGIMYNQVSGRR